MILAGDIGGTKTVVALYEAEGDVLVQRSETVYPSAEHESLDAIVADFLGGRPEANIEGACFGVAGVVREGRARTTNLPWNLDADELGRRIGCRRVALLNDLEAAAYGMLHLRSEDRVVLCPGAADRRGNIAVIAAGTGLGESALVWDGERHRAVASEGGHASFAPNSDREIELLRFLREDLGGHVSGERVLSGPGLRNIYRFLRHSGAVPEPGWLAERMETEDASAVISELGIKQEDPVCVEALELFAAIYGSEAGNAALRTLALGGVFLGGGIAPKILPVLQTGAFRDAYLDKGRFAELLKRIEVSVSLEPRAPLLGAAYYAAEL